ncbi:MAG: hypothetical protein P1U74_01560 [Legionellaceae bacterium]|nr:hypothetical protein [Legionellaceae bacterium]
MKALSASKEPIRAHLDHPENPGGVVLTPNTTPTQHGLSLRDGQENMIRGNKVHIIMISLSSNKEPTIAHLDHPENQGGVVLTPNTRLLHTASP